MTDPELKQAEAADEQHRVTPRAIKTGVFAAVNHKRTLGDALDASLRAIKDQRSHEEYERSTCGRRSIARRS